MNRLFSMAALLVFFCCPSWAASYGPYGLSAPIAVDGDTLRATVHIWPDLTADVAIRVRGVDTPEIRGATQCERDKAIAAREFTDAWLVQNRPITIHTVAPDKYAGRVDAVVVGLGGERLSDALIQSGHGRPYSGGARKPWCQ